MSKVEDKLKKLGYTLPVPRPPSIPGVMWPGKSDSGSGRSGEWLKAEHPFADFGNRVIRRHTPLVLSRTRSLDNENPTDKIPAIASPISGT